MLAVIDMGVQRARMDAACAAAQGLGRFEDGNGMPVLFQPLRGGQAGPARSDDGDIHRPGPVCILEHKVPLQCGSAPRRLTSPRPPPTQTFQALQNLRLGESEMRCPAPCTLTRSLSTTRQRYLADH